MATPVGGGIRAMIVDLTHQLNPDIPVWPGNEPFSHEPVKTFADDGFYAQSLTFWEHTGTHVDAPIHFIEGAMTADMIDIGDLFAPLVVIDISARATDDPDTAVTPEDIATYEADYGEIPAGALVAMNSGWSAWWQDPAAFVNLDADGVQHYPGFHPDAADMLVNQRDIVGIAVDTLSQDPGNSTDFGTHITILGAGKYAIEGLANVGQMDPAGGTVYVGAPKHVDASGGPARVIGFNRTG
jgi:kynurenine formamidase